MNQISVFDHQHYIDRGWGGSADGEAINCTHFDRLVVCVTWQTAGGLGIARLRLLGTNIDTDAHQLEIALPPAAASDGVIIGAHDVQHQNLLGGEFIAVWRNLPK